LSFPMVFSKGRKKSGVEADATVISSMLI
jgi:hypothetical protein